CQHYNSLSLTF
nr:immunoglobulin light chain junction region [Macaca mulatta]